MSLVEDVQALNLMPSQEDAIWYIAKLVAAQNEKWGLQDHPDHIWSAINLEEVGEANECVVPPELPLISGFDETEFRATADMRAAIHSAVSAGTYARTALEMHFDPANATGVVQKSRVNGSSHPPDFDKEIGQVAATAADWLAARWRRE